MRSCFFPSNQQYLQKMKGACGDQISCDRWVLCDLQYRMMPEKWCRPIIRDAYEQSRAQRNHSDLKKRSFFKCTSWSFCFIVDLCCFSTRLFHCSNLVTILWLKNSNLKIKCHSFRYWLMRRRIRQEFNYTQGDATGTGRPLSHRFPLAPHVVSGNGDGQNWGLLLLKEWKSQFSINHPSHKNFISLRHRFS